MSRLPSVAPAKSAGAHLTHLGRDVIIPAPIVPLLDPSPRTTSLRRAIKPSSCSPAELAFFLLVLEVLHFTPAGTAIVDSVAPDQVLALPRVDPLTDFPFAIEIGEGDVEAMDVGGNDCQKKHDAIEDEVLVGTCDHHDGERGEKDVEDGNDKAFEEWDPHFDGVRVERFGLMRLISGGEYLRAFASAMTLTGCCLRP